MASRASAPAWDGYRSKSFAVEAACSHQSFFSTRTALIELRDRSLSDLLLDLLDGLFEPRMAFE